LTDKTKEPKSVTQNAKNERELCLVIYPYVKSHRWGGRDPSARLDEIVSLALAIDVDVIHAEVVSLGRIKPSTLFGKGKVEGISDSISSNDIGVAIIDTALTPIQQRNLERAWNCKVIDRTSLILEIFGERAKTREGRLQVDLAALTYQRSRLVRSWTHLERQRGGAGFMGGPGETQIETDRRQIDHRITRLRRDLKDVKRTRELHRKARRKVPYPIVALVGYTNAGKSTLFNRLTDSSVEAKDQLFATLDPTMRSLRLTSGRSVILSDTVGFISYLPHELVTAFHATLEEVTEANIVIHVRDAAHPDTQEQKRDVLKVMAELGLTDPCDNPQGEDVVGTGQFHIEVLNKIDSMDAEQQEIIRNKAVRSSTRVITLSALTGDGCQDLLNGIDELLAQSTTIHDINLEPADGASLSWLYDHGEVVERDNDEDGVHLKVRLDTANWARFERR
jgi:GTP-binding protein HflX